MNGVLAIAAAMIGGLLTIIGALIALNLRSIGRGLQKFTSRIDKQDDAIRQCRDTIAACKVDCDRTNVSKEDWVRSEGYTRRELKEITGVLARLEGKLTIVEQLPQVCAGVVKQVIQQITDRGPHDG